MRLRPALIVAFTVLAVAAIVPSTAQALAPCPGPAPVARTLLSGQGTLESVIADHRGRLFFTSDDALLRLDHPDGEPRLLVPVPEPGGLAFDTDGSLLVGFGNSPSNGSIGDVAGPSGLLRVDPDSGESEVYATGLSMANGLVRGPDGSFYASNDFGSNIDRIEDGKTERGWAQVESGNGLAIDSEGRYLYAAQTFRPAAIQKVALDDPTDVSDYVRAGPEDVAAGLDGMTRDGADNLFVTANGAGQVWRVGSDPVEACLLLDGLAPFPDGPSAVATGAGRGFPRQNVYVVTFDGNVIEIADVAVPVRRARLRLAVRPHRAVRGERTRFRFRVTVGKGGKRVAVEDVRIRFAHQVAATNAEGRAAITATLTRRGRHRARARHFDYRRDRSPVRVRAGG
jgi:gluconolactonase